jgi:hypothetical protein
VGDLAKLGPLYPKAEDCDSNKLMQAGFEVLTAVVTNSTVFWDMTPCKITLSLCLTNKTICHEGVWGSRCIDPSFLDLGPGWS